MNDRCDLRDYCECSCGPDQCRVQNLGTFTKPRPTPSTAAPPYMLIGLAGLIIAWGFFVFVAAPAFERVKHANQESSVAWQK